MTTENPNNSKFKIALSVIAGVAIISTGTLYHTSASNNVKNDKAQVTALKQTISETKKANAKDKAKNEKAAPSTTNKNSSDQDVLKETQDNMNFASTFVLNYIKAMEGAESLDAIRTLNKTYLSDNAKIPTIVGGGDDGKISNNIFGGDINKIKTVPSLPNSDNQIIVYAYSEDSTKVSFRATYDLAQKKIVNTQTYSIAK